MNRSLYLIPIIAVVLALLVVPAVSEESDAAINIGEWYGNIDWSENESTSSQAYENIFGQFRDINEIPNNETFYVLNGARLLFNVGNGIHISLSGSNPLNLSLLDMINGSEINGPVNGLGTSTYTITNGTTSKTIRFTSVTDTTVYLTSLDYTITPSNPQVGDHIKLTPVFTPSNATYNTISEHGGSFFTDCLDGVYSSGGSYYGTVAESGEFEIRLTAQTRLDVLGDTVTCTDTITIPEPPDPIEIQIYGDTAIQVGEEFSLSATVTGGEGIPSDKDADWSIVSGSKSVELDRLQVGNNYVGTGIAPGTVVFRATSIEDPSVHEDWTMTVSGTYTLDFNANGGSGAPSQLTYGPTTASTHQFTIPTAEPTWTGHTFQGWATTSGASTAAYNPGGSITVEDASTTLYAVWEVEPIEISINGPTSIEVGERFTLTVNVTGGAGDVSGDSYVTWSVVSGSEFIQLDPVQINDTYTGMGIADGTVVFRATSIEDPSVHEDWTMTVEGTTPTTTYTLNFNANGGSGAPSQLTYGPTTDLSHSFTIPLTEPTWAGHEFKGWAASSSTTIPSVQPGEGYVLYADDPTRTLYAVWIEDITIEITGPTSINVGDSFTLTATVTGGTGDVSGDSYVTWSVVSGSEFIQLDPVQINDTYTGMGIADGTVVFRATSIEDPSVHEDWTMTVEGTTPTTTYTLNFNANGGSGAPQQMTYGPTTDLSHSFTIPNYEPSWTGHIFKGWAASSSTTIPSVQPGEGYVLYADDPTRTLYAVWSVGVEIEITGPSTIEVGERFTLMAIVSGGVGNATWSVVSGEDCVELDALQVGNYLRGEAVAAGTVVFRATSTEDPNVQEDWTLTITTPIPMAPSSIQITGPGDVLVGDDGTIYATVLPNTADTRTVQWSVTSGADFISYTTTETYNGGRLDFTAKGAGTVTFLAVSTVDSEVRAVYTLTILTERETSDGSVQINGVIQAAADSIFGGNTAIPGIILFVAVVLGLFLIIRDPLPVLIIGIPVALIFRVLSILSTDVTIILIIVAVVGLAMVARNMWRD